MKRRLAAILVADVVGYSHLMGKDEVGTLASLKGHRKELIEPEVERHRGRIVKLMGDGVLVEFASVVDAVQCAVDIQCAMAERNADIPEDRQIAFRVGINLDDVIVEDDDIYGDGVNIAARLQTLAEPGGICISDSVYNQVKRKLDLSFENLGEQHVKNIDKPVGAFGVLSRAGTAIGAVSGTEVSADAIPGFGGRPAIAVLPFDYLAGGADEEHFAEGVAEEILTRLAMWRWLPVIARNSSFAYKGRTMDVRQIGRELGARYVLEGSVRKADNRVRIAGKLIDADSGHHVWADRYDRKLEDLFELQDDITDQIVAALEPAVGQAEQARAYAKRPDKLDAWDACQRGLWHHYQYTKCDNELARSFLGRAIELDSGFALPHSGLALVNVMAVFLGWAADAEEALLEARREAFIAQKLDAMDPYTLVALSYTATFNHEYDAAIQAANQALRLNPSFAIAHHALSYGLFFGGDPESAIPAIKKALRLSPNDPLTFFWLTTLSVAHYLLRRYEDALSIAEQALRRGPHYSLAHRARASALAQLGRLAEARTSLAAFLQLVPDYSYEDAKIRVPFKNQKDYQHYFDGIRKAGWQDG